MTPEQVSKFKEACNSLLHLKNRRLSDADTSTPTDVTDLYTDLLPNDGILETLVEPRSQIIIGRRGTGKSTLFDRLRVRCEASDLALYVYVDVSDIEQELNENPPTKFAERLQWIDQFVRKVATSIDTEIRQRIETQATLLQKLQGIVGAGTQRQVEQRLAELLDLDSCIEHLPINEITSELVQVGEGEATEREIEGGLFGQLGKNSSIFGGVRGARRRANTTEQNRIVENALLKSFRISKFAGNIVQLLDLISIKQLYVVVDEFSELSDGALEILEKYILLPLCNSSSNRIKFKIGAYPGRAQMLHIDVNSYDEIYLDPAELYGGEQTRLPEIERRTLDFVKRLLDARIKHFVGKPAEFFFSPTHKEEVWSTLRDASGGNPRTLGFLLRDCITARLADNRKIIARTIQNAAQKHYQNKVHRQFGTNKLKLTQTEQATRDDLIILLDRLVDEATQLSRKRDISHASHFYVDPSCAHFLDTLQMNHFVTKCHDFVTHSGKKVPLYALNYGLTVEKHIPYGRPTPNADYYRYAHFDFTRIVQDFVAEAVKVLCNSATCGGRVIERSTWEALTKAGAVLCPFCGQEGTISEQRVFPRSAEVGMTSPAAGDLLDPAEFQIMEVLTSGDDFLRVGEIADETGIHPTQVGKIALALATRGLLEKDERKRGGTRQRSYRLSDLGRDQYF